MNGGQVPHPFHSLIVKRVGQHRPRRSETGIGHCRIPPLRQKQLRRKDGAPSFISMGVGEVGGRLEKNRPASREEEWAGLLLLGPVHTTGVDGASSGNRP